MDDLAMQLLRAWGFDPDTVQHITIDFTPGQLPVVVVTFLGQLSAETFTVEYHLVPNTADG